jgi:hypothetical protein
MEESNNIEIYIKQEQDKMANDSSENNERSSVDMDSNKLKDTFTILESIIKERNDYKIRLVNYS